MRIGIAGPCSISELPISNTTLQKIEAHAFPYIAQLVKAYLNQGHEVHVFTSAWRLEAPVTLHENRLTVTAVPRRVRKTAACDLFRAERQALCREIASAQLNVVHAHWTYEYAWAALHANPRVLVTAHDAIFPVLRYYKHPYWWLRSLLGLLVVNQAKHLTAVSPSLAKEIRRYRFIHRGDAIRTIPNGLPPTNQNEQVDPSLFETKVGLPETGSILNTNSYSPTYVSVANGFDARKNTGVLIAAFQEVRRIFPGARMIMIGQGHGPGEAAQDWSLKRNLNLEGIDFRGALAASEVARILSEEVDILVHSSKWEACSMVLLEAQNQGLAIIANKRCGGVSFTLGDGVAGRLVDVTSVSAISEAMIDLGGDTSKRRLLGEAAARHVRKYFSEEAVVAEYLSALDLIAYGGARW